MDTEVRIAELEAAVAELRDENAALADLLRRVALCKGSNAKYPYWNWLCEQLVEGDDQSRLETTLGVLDDVAAGEEPHPLALRTLHEGARDLADRAKATGRVDRSALTAVVREIVGELEAVEVDELLDALAGQEMVPYLLKAID